MSAQWVLYSYLLAAGSAIFLLFLVRARRWYWHVLSFLLGLVVGLIPPPSGNGSNLFYLLTGTACVFFTMYGLGGPLFRRSSN